MGKMESKSVTAAPSEEQTIIEKHELFGWELKSSQEVLSRDSHLENRGDDLYNVTTTQNYVKLVFQRDADSPLAAKARTVEDEYWRLYPRTQPAVGVISWFQNYPFGEKLAHFILSLVFAAIFFGVSYAYRRFGYQRKVDAYLKNKDRLEAIEAEMKTV